MRYNTNFHFQLEIQANFENISIKIQCLKLLKNEAGPKRWNFLELFAKMIFLFLESVILYYMRIIHHVTNSSLLIEIPSISFNTYFRLNWVS